MKNIWNLVYKCCIFHCFAQIMWSHYFLSQAHFDWMLQISGSINEQEKNESAMTIPFSLRNGKPSPLVAICAQCVRASDVRPWIGQFILNACVRRVCAYMMKDTPSRSSDAAQTELRRTRLRFARYAFRVCLPRWPVFMKVLCKWMRESVTRLTQVSSTTCRYMIEDSMIHANDSAQVRRTRLGRDAVISSARGRLST